MVGRTSVQRAPRPNASRLVRAFRWWASGRRGPRANAHQWRIVNDLWDNWSALDALFDPLRDWTPYRATGAWPDPDMIPIGRLSKFGPVGSPRYSGLTTDEPHTLMTLLYKTSPARPDSPATSGGRVP